MSIEVCASLLAQAKPFAVLPGNGMAIEITLKTSEKVNELHSHLYTCTVHTTGHIDTI